MGARGIKYFRRGPKGKIKVGFFNYEIVLAIIANHPEGIPLSSIASKAKIHYNTARYIVLQLTDMKRLDVEKRKLKKGHVALHYKATPWKLD